MPAVIKTLNFERSAHICRQVPPQAIPLQSAALAFGKPTQAPVLLAGGLQLRAGVLRIRVDFINF